MFKVARMTPNFCPFVLWCSSPLLLLEHECFGNAFSAWSYKLVVKEPQLSSLRGLHVASARQMVCLNMSRFVFSLMRLGVLCP